MDQPGTSQINGYRAPAPGSEPDPARAREDHLRRLLTRVETGGLDAYEYARRVRALEEAPTAESMAEIVDAPVADQRLDPVDLALLARCAAPEHAARRQRTVWLAVVGIFFVVLMVLGLWLVSHTRSLGSGGMARPWTVVPSSAPSVAVSAAASFAPSAGVA